MYCQNCGAKREKDQNFCGNCGAALTPENQSQKASAGLLTLGVILSILTYTGIWIPLLGFIFGITSLAIVLRTPSHDNNYIGKYVAGTFSVIGLIITFYAFIYWMQVNAQYF